MIGILIVDSSQTPQRTKAGSSSGLRPVLSSVIEERPEMEKLRNLKPVVCSMSHSMDLSPSLQVQLLSPRTETILWNKANGPSQKVSSQGLRKTFSKISPRAANS
jgi:hypothetical protein